MSTALQVFDKSVCFGYQTRVFSVTRDAGTISTTRSRKEKIIQQVIHPSHVHHFGALKQEAYRYCRSAGTKLDLLDVWIIPEEHQEALTRKLDDVASRWNHYRDNDLAANYNKWIDEQCRDNPNEAVDIRRLAPPLNEVTRQTRFVFASFKLNAAQIKSDNLEEETGGLAEQALREIAAEIKDAGMHKSQTFTQMSRDVLRRVTRKAKSLAYLHPRLDLLATTVEELNGSLPATGRIIGIDALAMRSILDSILDPAKFMERGFGTIDESTSDLFDTDEVMAGNEAVRTASEDLKIHATEIDLIAQAASETLDEEPPQAQDQHVPQPVVDWVW